MVQIFAYIPATPSKKFRNFRILIRGLITWLCFPSLSTFCTVTVCPINWAPVLKLAVLDLPTATVQGPAGIVLYHCLSQLVYITTVVRLCFVHKAFCMHVPKLLECCYYNMYQERIRTVARVRVCNSNSTVKLLNVLKIEQPDTCLATIAYVNAQLCSTCYYFYLVQ